MKIMTESEDQWLEERRKRVSATELAELHRCKTAAVWQRIKNEKLTGERKDISHMDTIVWGNSRESLLAETLCDLDSRLVYNNHPQALFVWDDDPRICGTPDLYSEDLEVLGEIKTSGRDYKSGSYGLELPDQYYLQAQVNLMVTGAEVLLLLTEFHEDFEPQRADLVQVRPDLNLHKELHATALEFLAYLDGTAPDWMTDVVDLDQLDELHELSGNYIWLQQEKARIEKDMKEIREQIIALTGENAKIDLGSVTVTVSTSKPTMTINSRKLKKDHPDIWGECATERKGSTRLTITENE